MYYTRGLVRVFYERMYLDGFESLGVKQLHVINSS